MCATRVTAGRGEPNQRSSNRPSIDCTVSDAQDSFYAARTPVRSPESLFEVFSASKRHRDAHMNAMNKRASASRAWRSRLCRTDASEPVTVEVFADLEFASPRLAVSDQVRLVTVRTRTKSNTSHGCLGRFCRGAFWYSAQVGNHPQGILHSCKYLKLLVFRHVANGSTRQTSVRIHTTLFKQPQL